MLRNVIAIKEMIARLPLLVVASMAATISDVPNAQAADTLSDRFKLSGFGTLGVAQSNAAEGTEVIREQQQSGVTKHASFEMDSNLGLQASWQASESLSATMQLLAMHRSAPHLSAEVEWAFAKWTPVDRLTFRGGRMAMPLFAISDYRNVGYANTWIRPPNEVYGLALLQRLNGADATYQMPLADSNLSITVLGGSSFMDNPQGYVSVSGVRGANVQWENDGLAVRIGRVAGHVHAGPTADPYTFTGVGVSYDRGRIIAQTEYVARRSKLVSDAVNANGWYGLLGYRFNRLVPYGSYAATHPTQPSSFHISEKQTTSAAGLRWNVRDTVDVKFQFDHIETAGTAGISFYQATAAASATPPGDLTDAPSGGPVRSSGITHPVNVVSAAIDVVF